LDFFGGGGKDWGVKKGKDGILCIIDDKSFGKRKKTKKYRQWVIPN